MLGWTHTRSRYKGVGLRSRIIEVRERAMANWELGEPLLPELNAPHG